MRFVTSEPPPLSRRGSRLVGRHERRPGQTPNDESAEIVAKREVRNCWTIGEKAAPILAQRRGSRDCERRRNWRLGRRAERVQRRREPGTGLSAVRPSRGTRVRRRLARCPSAARYQGLDASSISASFRIRARPPLTGRSASTRLRPPPLDACFGVGPQLALCFGLPLPYRA